jgi:UDP-glucose 4-epimerase
MKRLAVTGSSGYLGSCLITYLQERHPGLQVLGIDIEPPRCPPTYDFVQLDMQSPDLEATLRRFAPDTLVHMAFIVTPQHNERRMRRVNIGGSQNVLRAVAAVRPGRCLIASSATALGAWPDNPVPLPDRQPPRARPEFRYAADKAELEQLVAAFAEQHADIAVSWVRPCIVMGPRMDNYLRRVLLKTPLMALLDGHDTPLQLVHEDDVSAAVERILLAEGRGPYNIAPPDWLTMSRIAALTNRRAVRLPFPLARWLAGLAWGLRFPLHEYPPGFLYFVRFPWVAAPARLEHELGFRFQYSTQATLASVTRRSP